jgi:hypothetical protein
VSEVKTTSEAEGHTIPTSAPHPKDLRDEFAMVAFSAHFSTDSLVKALRDMSERDNMNPTEILSKVCYEYADAMMKAREGK